ncbi:MAG: hypothetical protein KGV57_03615 [Fusobacterium sp.]|nr:hypothetical protein [Fusobacterium sp.]
MKKLMLVGMLAMGLVACGGEKSSYTSKAEKIEMIRKGIVEENADTKSKMNKILQELNEKAMGGDEKAKKEYDEWVVIQENVLSEAMIKEMLNSDLPESEKEEMKKELEEIEKVLGK